MKIHFIEIFIWVILAIFIIGVYRRTQIADYNVKFAHTEMSNTWNYCPMCGECLKDLKENADADSN